MKKLLAFFIVLTLALVSCKVSHPYNGNTTASDDQSSSTARDFNSDVSDSVNDTDSNTDLTVFERYLKYQDGIEKNNIDEYFSLDEAKELPLEMSYDEICHNIYDCINDVLPILFPTLKKIDSAEICSEALYMCNDVGIWNIDFEYTIITDGDKSVSLTVMTRADSVTGAPYSIRIHIGKRAVSAGTDNVISAAEKLAGLITSTDVKGKITYKNYVFEGGYLCMGEVPLYICGSNIPGDVAFYVSDASKRLYSAQQVLPDSMDNTFTDATDRQINAAKYTEAQARERLLPEINKLMGKSIVPDMDIPVDAQITHSGTRVVNINADGSSRICYLYDVKIGESTMSVQIDADTCKVHYISFAADTSESNKNVVEKYINYLGKDKKDYYAEFDFTGSYSAYYRKLSDGSCAVAGFTADGRSYVFISDIGIEVGGYYL